MFSKFMWRRELDELSSREREKLTAKQVERLEQLQNRETENKTKKQTPWPSDPNWTCPGLPRTANHPAKPCGNKCTPIMTGKIWERMPMSSMVALCAKFVIPTCGAENLMNSPLERGRNSLQNR